MGLEFGAVAPCRECGGVGSVKHRADPAARGHDVPPPPSMDLCPVCHGRGILPAAEADHPEWERNRDELPFR